MKTLGKFYRHKNWGGVFTLNRYPEDKKIAVTMQDEPENWPFLRAIGWEKQTFFDEEDECFFIEI